MFMGFVTGTNTTKYHIYIVFIDSLLYYYEMNRTYRTSLANNTPSLPPLVSTAVANAYEQRAEGALCGMRMQFFYFLLPFNLVLGNQYNHSRLIEMCLPLYG